MGLSGILPTIPLDAQLQSIGYRTGPRAASGIGPGSLFNPVVGTTQGFFPYSEYRNPADTAARFPEFEFGHIEAVNNWVAECEEHNLLIWSLCHAAAPWAGEDPWLSVLDLWAGWVRPDLHRKPSDLAQASGFGFTEDDVNLSIISCLDPASYGARVLVTGGGGDPALTLAASRENQAFVGSPPLLDPPVDGEYHRWTFRFFTRDAAGNPGFVELYYDERFLWSVPTDFLPKAAMYFHAFVSSNGTLQGTRRGFKFANVQLYHSRDPEFFPWRFPLRVKLERTKQGLVFQDDFNRPNSNTVGNGWSEVENAAADLTIDSNQIAHLAGGNYDTRAHRTAPAVPAGSYMLECTAQGNGPGLLFRGSDLAGGLFDMYLWIIETFTAPDRWALYKGVDGAFTLLQTANAQQDNGPFTNQQNRLRAILEPSGQALTIKGYGEEKGVQAFALRVTHTEDPAPTVQFDDGFDADSSAQYTTGGDGAATWTWDTPNSQLVADAGNQAHARRNGVSEKDPIIDVEVNEAFDGGIIARFQDNSNYYLVAIRDDQGVGGSQNTIQLYKRVAGAFTSIQLAAISFVRGTAHTVQWVLSGQNHKVYFDAVLKIDVNDAEFTTAGTIGLRHHGAAGQKAKYQRFKVTRPGSTPLTGTGYGIRIFTQGDRCDAFFLCGRDILVRGLRQGWKARVGMEPAVAPDAQGVATIDVDLVALPQGAIAVLDENNQEIGRVVLPSDVWGGDEFEVVGAE